MQPTTFRDDSKIEEFLTKIDAVLNEYEESKDEQHRDA